MADDASPAYRVDMQAIQAHITILQAIIQRMSGNSASAKAWVVGLVSAILALASGDKRAGFAWVALLPILAFLILDAYYLGLERGFIASYNAFVSKVHRQELTLDDVLVVAGPRGQAMATWTSLRSLSVWPFYACLALLTVFVAHVTA